MASDRSAWIRLDMDLTYRATGLWQWRVILWAAGNDPEHQARIVVGFVVNARTGAVTPE